MLSHEECCDLVEIEVDRFAAVLERCPSDAPVPSCPHWTAGELATHLGMVHRWAAGLVARRSPVRLGYRELGLVEEPPTPTWMRDGGALLVAALRAADPDAPMWVWGADPHVRWWSRRQLHETMVHRVDLELAAGEVSDVDPALCADGVDELLVNLPTAAYFSPNVLELRGSGERLRLVADDCEDSWVVTFEPDRFRVEREPPRRRDVAAGSAAPGSEDVGPPVQATVTGPAPALLLACYRRQPFDAGALRLDGDESVTSLWFEHCALA